MKRGKARDCMEGDRAARAHVSLTDGLRNDGLDQAVVGYSMVNIETVVGSAFVKSVRTVAAKSILLIDRACHQTRRSKLRILL